MRFSISISTALLAVPWFASALSNLPFATKVRLDSTTGEQLNMFEVQVYSSGVNVASQGLVSATQSSIYKNEKKFDAPRAIDGDNTTFCHTDDDDASWEVELDELVEIESIVILNRYCRNETDPTGCLCRLSEATITLLDQDDSTVTTRTIGNTCAQLTVSESFTPAAPTDPPSTSPTAPTNPPSTSPTTSPVSAKKVRLASTTGEQLNMFEVQIYSSGVNVASQGLVSATQSSIYQNEKKFDAPRAIDGDNTTFCHTNDSNAWWQFELYELKEIDSIVILNRYCRNETDPTGCLCRLSEATITLLDQDDSPVATSSIANTCGQSVVVAESFDATSSAEGILADTVRLESIAGEQIQMFEVQVYSSGINVALEGTASQSSTYKDYDKFAASNAIDGDGTTFSHTNDDSPTWEVLLSESAVISEIVIQNRYCQNEDDPNGCLCRLSNATLTLYVNNLIVATRSLGNTCGTLVLSELFNTTTNEPSSAPSKSPTISPSMSPTISPSATPTTSPIIPTTPIPTKKGGRTPRPTPPPTPEPTHYPTPGPTPSPFFEPPLDDDDKTLPPTPGVPTPEPTSSPTPEPTPQPTPHPVNTSDDDDQPQPTVSPTTSPTASQGPTSSPTTEPTQSPMMPTTSKPTPNCNC